MNNTIPMSLSKKFISYKSQQYSIAYKVHKILEGWGYTTWFDKVDIRSGRYFRDEIEIGLNESDTVIGIVTEKSLKSQEVLSEWHHAYSTETKRLLLLCYEDVVLPYWLKPLQYIDCVEDEDAGLKQLRHALTQPDPADYHSALIPESLKPKSSAIAPYNPSQVPANNREKMLYKVYELC